MKKFNDLVKLWKEETKFISSSTEIVSNKNYLEILKMGEFVLPLIIKDYKENGGHWSHALKTITGVDPISQDMWGNMEKTRECWINWYENNNKMLGG